MLGPVSLRLNKCFSKYILFSTHQKSTRIQRLMPTYPNIPLRYNSTNSNFFSNESKRDEHKIETTEDDDNLELELPWDLEDEVTTIPPTQQQKQIETKDTFTLDEDELDLNQDDMVDSLLREDSLINEDPNMAYRLPKDQRAAEEQALEDGLSWLNTETDYGNMEEDHLILRPLTKRHSPLDIIDSNVPTGIMNAGKQKGKPFLSSHFNAIDFHRDLQNLMVFKKERSEDQLIEDIDGMKPHGKSLSRKNYKQLSKDLSRSFTVKQLKEYAWAKGIEQKFSNFTKVKIVKIILSDIWQVKETDNEEDLLVTQEVISLANKRELFLLLSHTGHLLHSWSRLGAKLSIASDNNEFVVRGSPSIVNFVLASWNNLLNKVETSELDLNDLNKFYTEKLGKEIPIESLQMLSNAHFDKVNKTDESYILSSFNRANILLAKSALLAATDYTATSSTVFDKSLIPSNNKLIFQSYTDNSLPWYIQNSPVYRLKTPTDRLRISKPKIIETENLTKELSSLKAEANKAEEKFEYNFIEKTHSEEKQVHEIELNPDDTELDLLDDTEVDLLDDTALTEISTSNTHIEQESIPFESQGPEKYQILQDLDIDKIYKELTPDLSEQRTENWYPRVINATFGKMLFKDQSIDSNCFFHQNLPEVNKKLSTLELLNKEAKLFGINGGIKNHFQNSLQIKLVPNGFENFNNFETLPNVEIWLEINKNKVDKNAIQLFVNQNEKNYQVALPMFKTDMMYQSSYNSALSNSNNLYSTQKELSKFIRSLPTEQMDVVQPDAINKLLNSLKTHTVDINLDDKHQSIPYSITSINKIRSIELEFENFPVVYQVVSKGDADRFEVSIFLEDSEESMSKEKFEEFNKTVLKFLEFIDK